MFVKGDSKLHHHTPPRPNPATDPKMITSKLGEQPPGFPRAGLPLLQYTQYTKYTSVANTWREEHVCCTVRRLRIKSPNTSTVQCREFTRWNCQQRDALCCLGCRGCVCDALRCDAIEARKGDFRPLMLSASPSLSLSVLLRKQGRSVGPGRALR